MHKMQLSLFVEIKGQQLTHSKIIACMFILTNVAPRIQFLSWPHVVVRRWFSD